MLTKVVEASRALSYARSTIFLIAFLLILSIIACNKEKSETKIPEKSFPKEKPQKLNYENISQLIQDMHQFSKSLKPLDRKKVQEIADRYIGVFFELPYKPLFLNVYPDPPNKRVVFLIVPKDPATGSTYLMKFDKNLPIVNSDTLEIQIRLQDQQLPLTCLLPMEDPDAYVQEVQSHMFTVQFKLLKRFLQSGTFDFDALTIPSYRTRNVPFIVFDLADAELTDSTAKLSCRCKQM